MLRVAYALEVVFLNGRLLEPLCPVEEVQHLPPLTDQIVLHGGHPLLLVFVVKLEVRVLCHLFCQKMIRFPSPLSGAWSPPRPGVPEW